jgi:hypothetical protein
VNLIPSTSIVEWKSTASTLSKDSFKSLTSYSWSSVSIALGVSERNGWQIRDSDEVVEETSVNGLGGMGHVYSSFEFRLELGLVSSEVYLCNDIWE